MFLLNFSHPITPDQMRRILEIMDRTDIKVHDIPTQIDNSQPLVSQVVAVVDRCPISSVAWQATPILVHLPGYAPVAGALLAELHGRMGHFPAMVRLRPVAGSMPTVFEVAEILNLQAVREAARERR
jgi:hypothetical protein